MALIAEIIFSGFVSKTVNDITDISKDKIRKAVKNKNSKHQNMESQIYNVIVDVLNKITSNQYKCDQDKIYDAAEVLLKAFKENAADELRNIQSCLRIFQLNVDENGCMEFKALLYGELGKNEYVELFRAILLLLLDQKNQYDWTVYKLLNKKLDDVILILNCQNNIDKNNGKQQKVNSRTQEYADKWNENMFLNDFDEWDEKAGVNVKLKDVYLENHLPHFKWGDNTEESDNLKKLLSKYIMKRNKKSNKNEMLLILGQPGIGKSTLITWIIAHFKNIRDDILVFRFVSDLKSIVWKTNLLDQIRGVLNLSYQELEGKILILDGYDEIDIDKRGEVLNNLYEELVKKNVAKKLTIIITCRENYISNLNKLRCGYITLQIWDKNQIRSFCEIWQLKTSSFLPKSTINNTVNNYMVFGIPIVLYMTLALNVRIDKENALVDLYDQIFSLEGGIYDRCIANIKYEYSHRISAFKRQIHEVSKRVACWMFENNSEEAIIPEDEYRTICQNIIEENEFVQEFDSRDFLIGNYFKCYMGVGTGHIYFVHRTMYEYFVVEAIFESIESAVKELSEESQELLAGNIAFYLKEGQFSRTISDYFMRKMLNVYNELSNEKKCRFYNWWENAVDKMMENGMFYYTDKKMHNYRRIITKEANCFLNLTEILRKIAFYITPRRYIMENVNSGRLERYIRHCCLEFEKCDFSFFDLSGIELMGTDLEQINFIGANLNGLDLQNENLKDALLQGANLEGTDLREADLQGAHLEDATLKFASLVSANLCEANLSGANLFQADLRHADLRKAKLDNTELDATKWCTDELNELRLQIKEAKFTYVIVEDSIPTKLYRSELFPEENKALL